MKNLKISLYALLIGGVVFTTSCGKDPNYQGTEFAPQMYISKGYEPYSQVEPNKINPYGMNMRVPAKGTVARRFANSVTGESQYQGDLMYYNIEPGDAGLAEAEKTLTPPFEADDKVLEDGKVLYTRYCSPCHGEKGDGQGKVAGMYKGVANISSTGALKNVNSGHIYHVITHGKGRMWPHASQLNPDERWKVVYYVHTLQGQDPKNLGKEAKKEDDKSDKKDEKSDKKEPKAADKEAKADKK
jgi:mono/diheme cytochrome c family protein